MTKQIIKKKIDRLPENKMEVVSDYIDYILQKSDDEIASIQLITLQEESGAFNFLKDEPDLYTDDKLLEVYK